MLNNDQVKHVQSILFAEEEHNVYAVVDGAACPELRFKLYDWQPISSCLWSGDLEPDIEEVAPYMVKLEKGADITEWLIKEGWGNHWNIFVSSILNPKEFRKQIRKLQLARSPEGKTLFFRFYDPRVLEIFLPSSDAQQRVDVFMKIERFYFPSSEMNSLLCVSNNDTKDEIEITHHKVVG
ncbi:DUF4123 domain-containing protein [Alteromonas sp. ASW11-130]|uniref:DUF4123 domain-containing protein n=1 Tax=Alteromonas sp. ASW11-130 TaxID=3015775 RepID=UPI0022423C86|nr:DUF4123 domain-containing protein [Alteromonas sp. ASW11-130]MCW8090317.1 DUF4123 domain-containing protein [Alteromonas sp. ASW11-130]